MVNELHRWNKLCPLIVEKTVSDKWTRLTRKKLNINGHKIQLTADGVDRSSNKPIAMNREGNAIKNSVYSAF